MKKIILSLSILMTTIFTSFGQATVNGSPINGLDVDYVQIVGRSNLMGTKVTVDLEFGQQNKLFSNEDTKILDSDGSTLKLNSMVDALNFMSDNGYDFVAAYAITIGNQNVYHFLMKKKDE
jgi:hypothetical protein|tara:strand:- start:1117 stop:1479 length:363 start_codon:yes stop_codon:yes gene_type:complete